MAACGDRTKNRIISAARELFWEKGYSSITMKDISDAAEISRGGLYRHFSSTEEIFAEILKREQQSASNALKRGIELGASAEVIVSVFLKYRINTLFGNVHGVDNAVSDFASSSKNGKQLITDRAQKALDILREIIAIGCERGEFSCTDISAAALSVLCLLEGLNKHNAVIRLSRQELEAQKSVILRQILGIKHAESQPEASK